MISNHTGCELAVLAVLGVLMIFLFPGMHGSYSVMHGPVTALLAARAAARVWSVMVQSAMNLLGNRLFPSLAVLSYLSFSVVESQSAGLPEYNLVLRC